MNLQLCMMYGYAYRKLVGWVLTANCSCMAGLGSACSHVAALLFKIESACHLKLTEGILPTSVLCEWKKSKKSVQPAPIKLINFISPRKHQLPKEISHKSLKRRNFSTKNLFVDTYPLTKDELKKLHQENPPSAIFTSIDPSCLHEYSNSDDSLTIDSSSETEETTLPEPLTSVYDPTAINLSNEELQIRCTKAYEKYKNEFTQNQFSNLSLHTCAQSANPSWQLHRAGRITASICKEVFCTDHTQIANKTLFEKIMQYTIRKPTKQMQYGSAMESSARDWYFATQKQQHVNLSVREAGFHVRVDYPFLGASPDGIVSCDCHDQKLLEIKCPSKYENGFLNWENDKDFPLAKDHSLKTSHQYYFQVQLQMFICKFSSVDFLFIHPKTMVPSC